ncbi:MAG: helicase-related protein [Candidatus Hodarchaeota archaeon]
MISTNSERNGLKNQYLKEMQIEFRQYQVEIAKKCVNHNSLVVLPTGLGKTIIAVLVAAYTLELYPKNSKVIVLAPTRPLINQHFETFKNLLKFSEENFAILTGRINPGNRKKIFETHQIIFYTPQTLRNDLVKKKYTLNTTCLTIFDEAHHSSGDYPYPLIADEYLDQNPDGNILALTASPGASKSKIEDLCKILHIPLQNIHTRIRTDQDVKSYIKPMDIYKVSVDLTQLMIDAYLIIQLLLEERLRHLSHLGFSLKTPANKSVKLSEKILRKDLLKLNSELISITKSDGDKTGVYSALSVNAQALILYHMLDLIEQQGLDVLFKYLLKIKEDARRKTSSKAIKILASENRLHQMFLELMKYDDVNPEVLIHPKYKVLEKIIIEQLEITPNSRILVFVKLRDSVKNITKKLNETGPIKASRFVGQATKSKHDKGLSQKKQLEILENFKQGSINVLVSTNVGEEGLDIAECDLVIFYDVVTSEIRFIQRKGRTARQRQGKVIILYCKGTHDEIYLKIAMNKLKRMKIHLKAQEKLQTQVFEKEEIPEKGDSLQHSIKKVGQMQLYKFMDPAKNLEKKQSQEKIILSKDVPVKFGLRKRLQKEGINYTRSNKWEHIIIHGKVLIHIYTEAGFDETFQNELSRFINKHQQTYSLIIIILDYIDFKEQINGELRVIKKKVREFANLHHYKIIPIQDTEELWFILKSIFEKAPKVEE